jgi:uncharacterized protein YxjI
MGAPDRYEVTDLGLSGSEYVVEQTGQDGNLRPEYEARDVTGEAVFRCTYEMYEGRDSFPFVDEDGEELFVVEATGTIDVAGNYVLTDSQTGDELVVLDNDVSFLGDTWRIRDAEDGTVLAALASRGGLVALCRALLPVGQFIGHQFDITDAEDRSVGTIESGFGIRDQYEVTISDASSIPIASVVAATVVIDAIQGN